MAYIVFEFVSYREHIPLKPSLSQLGSQSVGLLSVLMVNDR